MCGDRFEGHCQYEAVRKARKAKLALTNSQLFFFIFFLNKTPIFNFFISSISRDGLLHDPDPFDAAGARPPPSPVQRRLVGSPAGCLGDPPPHQDLPVVPPPHVRRRAASRLVYCSLGRWVSGSLGAPGDHAPRTPKPQRQGRRVSSFVDVEYEVNLRLLMVSLG